MRIGGEMEMIAQSFGTALDPDDWPRARAPHHLWTDSGRSALCLAARDHLARGGNAHVHIPAFSCISVMQPFLAAGYEIAVYDNTPIDGSSVLPTLTRGDLLVVLHYFGAWNGDRPRLAEEAEAAGARVIDDFVQASLNADWEMPGDYAVTSLRKFLSVPDGACLLSREPVDARLAPSDEQFVSQRIAGKLLRQVASDAALFLDLIEQSEERLAADTPRLPSRAAALLLGSENLPVIRERRRANWTAIAKGIGELQEAHVIRALLSDLRESEAPLGFPVIIANGLRDRIRAELRKAGIFCPVHWDLSHMAAEVAPRAIALSRQIMTVPIDQRYTPQDMRAVAGTIKRLLQS